MIVAAVLLAAGSGERLGAGLPKAFVTVAGRCLLAHAADRFLAHDGVRDLVVAAPAQLTESAAELVPAARIVPGGRTRQDSVARALAGLAVDVDTVLVHDVARAFVPPEVIDRVLGALSSGAAGAVPVLPVTDTIRRTDPDTDALGEVVDRSRLRAMQTPQGFTRSVLDRAHAHAVGGVADATDDAALVEALGVPVVAVPGDVRAFKVTVPLDLMLAEALLAHSGDTTWWNVGHG